jgi:hypothetical protein
MVKVLGLWFLVFDLIFVLGPLFFVLECLARRLGRRRWLGMNKTTELRFKNKEQSTKDQAQILCCIALSSLVPIRPEHIESLSPQPELFVDEVRTGLRSLR